MTRISSILGHREGDANGEVVGGVSMATPKLKTTSLVKNEWEMERYDVELDDNQEVRQDEYHYRLPIIELFYHRVVHAKDKSHGFWLEVMACSHS